MDTVPVWLWCCQCGGQSPASASGGSVTSEGGGSDTVGQTVAPMSRFFEAGQASYC